MPRPFAPLTLETFAERLKNFRFTRPIRAVHMHHTWKPRKSDYRGLETVESMWRHHTRVNGWSDIAQHLSIAPDGTIWTGRDWNRTPASAEGFNSGAFMFETIGDFDVGQERLEGAQLRAVIEVIARVQLRCGLPVESLHFHREFTDQKSCPGTGLRKAEILAQVRRRRTELETREPVLPERLPELEPVFSGWVDTSRALRTSRTVSAYAPVGDVGTDDFDRPFADRELEEVDGVRGFLEEEEGGEPECGGVPAAREFAAPDEAARGGGLTPEEIAALRPHVVNLRQGRFSTDGAMQTSAGDVDAIFHEHLPRALEDARARGEKLRVLFYAHGGLVSEGSGLRGARLLVDWWKRNGVYPIYFVWETGLWETLVQLLSGRRELAAARGLSDVSDRILEEVARRAGGVKIWGGMKYSAERSVGIDGGARYLARKLGAFVAEHGGEVELHAAGHSAGAIFHSYFVPTALEHGAERFRTLSLLAPAIRVDAFLDRYGPVLGDGRGVDALTVFTMRRELELADSCGEVYRKSLLYLIHHALEARRGEPILGLEVSLRDDDELKELFGLAGNPARRAEVVWSRTGVESGRSASRSRTHGRFDNDRATMESVLRRVLDVSDDARIEPFPEEATRSLDFDFAAVAPLGVEDFGVPAEEPALPEVPVEEPAVAVEEGTGRRRALCVGIDAYPGDARLAGCVADARLWADRLRGLGFEVDLLLDGKATQAGILAALKKLVGGGRPGDVLVFQYSGHGTYFRDTDSDEGDRQDEALVPVDYPRGRFVLDDEQFRVFDGLAEGVSLTCFYDCCHSGTMARFALEATLRGIREMGTEDVRPRFIDPTEAMWEEYRRRRGATRTLERGGLRDAESLRAVVFSACRDDEVALESRGQGVFTGHATRLLADAFARRVSNAEFQRRVTDAFGPRPVQNPGLDCARRNRSLPLLRQAVRPVGSFGDGTGGHPSGDVRVELTRRAWEKLLGSLNQMEPEALYSLIDEAKAILRENEG